MEERRGRLRLRGIGFGKSFRFAGSFPMTVALLGTIVGPLVVFHAPGVRGHVALRRALPAQHSLSSSAVSQTKSETAALDTTPLEEDATWGNIPDGVYSGQSRTTTHAGEPKRASLFGQRSESSDTPLTRVWKNKISTWDIVVIVVYLIVGFILTSWVSGVLGLNWCCTLILMFFFWPIMLLVAACVWCCRSATGK